MPPDGVQLQQDGMELSYDAPDVADLGCVLWNELQPHQQAWHIVLQGGTTQWATATPHLQTNVIVEYFTDELL